MNDAGRLGGHGSAGRRPRRQGTVTIGDGGIGYLYCDGYVTVDGGTYEAAVNAKTLSSDMWASGGGFLIGGTATLTVNTISYPVGGKVPAGKSWSILGGKNNSITGDFSTKNLSFGDGTGKKYTAGPDAQKFFYDVSS